MKLAQGLELSGQPDSRDRWIRLPTKGRCPFTGMSRGWFYDAIGRGVIKSASLRKPGKLTGVRVVYLASVMDYIEKNVEKTPQGADLPADNGDEERASVPASVESAATASVQGGGGQS